MSRCNKYVHEFKLFTFCFFFFFNLMYKQLLYDDIFSEIGKISGVINIQ